MKRKFIRGLVWIYLLTKRLLKKPLFLLTLALIPIMTFAMSVFAEEESSIVRVGLYTMDNGRADDREIDGRRVDHSLSTV